MNFMRHATLRSAIAVARSSTTKTQTLRIASRFVAPSVARIAAPTAVRCFSQTFRVASEDAFQANKADNGITGSEEPGHGIFIRNMVFEANEDHLREAYEKYGEITKVSIARDARGLSRGYGFVWFTNVESRDKAIEGTDNSFWHGRRIHVAERTAKSSKSKEQRAMGPTKSIYIGNIPYETTDAELNRMFRELDNVKDVRVAVDRTTGWPRGFAHADFHDVEAATAAIAKLQGTTIGGRQLRLDYAAEATRGARDNSQDGARE